MTTHPIFSVQIFRRHWQGQLPLGYAVCALLWVCIPWGVAIALVFALIPLDSKDEWWGYGIFSAGALSSTLLAVWWAKGLFSLYIRLMAHNRWCLAMLPFALACYATWVMASDAAPGVLEMAQEVYALQQQQARCARQDRLLARPAMVMPTVSSQRLLLRGPIGSGTADALALALAQHPGATVLELDSPGGYVREASALQQMLQSRGMDTMVRGLCKSACTDVFISGKRRFVGPDAHFGFHQSGWCSKPQTDNDWSAREHAMDNLYRRQVVSQPFASRALSTPYHQMWEPPVVEVIHSGFATEWWVESLSVAVQPD
jgi:ATP-dependent protease ClpP protease subunit